MTLKSIRKKLLQKELNVVEYTKQTIQKAKELNSKLNAFNTISENEALEQASNYDKNFENYKSLPLFGINTSIKDVISTKGIRTTASSKILENYVPAFDATAVEKLKEKGTIIIGKNNSDPFAFGGSGENSGYGPVQNPAFLGKIPGGSSSGSAAAVKAGIVPFSIGTDTGGSIRQPAAMTGVSGLKCTYGRNSRYGLLAMASSLDTVGIIANNAEDIATVEEVIQGKDLKDSTSANRENEKFSEYLNDSIKGLKIGVVKEYFSEGLDKDIRNGIEETLKWYESKGAKLVDIELSYNKYAIPVYYIIVPAEISSNMGRYDGVRYGYVSDSEAKDIQELYENNREVLEAEVKRRIIIGTYVLSSGYVDAYYKKATKVRSLIKQDFDKAYEKVDVIASPVSPTVAWNIGEQVNDPLKMYLEDIYTVSANLCGIPAISFNIGWKTLEQEGEDVFGNKTNKLPFSMQFMGPHFSESKLLNVVHQYQVGNNKSNND